MLIFVHYKLHLFESIQLYEENDVSHVSFLTYESRPLTPKRKTKQKYTASK